MLGAYLAMTDDPEEKLRLEEIYKEYKNIMYNTAYGILKDKYLAEDAVHNAFMKLAKSSKKMGGIKCKETRNYLVISVRGAAVDIYNKNKKAVPTDEIEAEDALDLPRLVESRLERKRVFEIIKNMDKNYSDILMLKLFYDKSSTEIAELLNITPENASTRFFRAKEKLKKLIMEEYGK